VGHPEFVWASFEHSTAPITGKTDTGSIDLQRDVAPIMTNDKNPDPLDPQNLMNATVVSDTNHILYQAGVKANEANKALDERTLKLVNQKFMKSDGVTAAQTSIYRMFPASKSNTIDADAAITSLNHNVEALFKTKGADDKRGNYRLLGAQWMDKPRYFDKNIPIQNDEFSPMVLGPHLSQDGVMVPAISVQTLKDAIIHDGSDSEFSILAGEDRMSSTAMESFTQGPGNFNNCFTCHNTQAITTNGIPTNRDPGTLKLLDAGLLNVSHILSQFLLEEHEDSLIP
jgi:nitrate reductase cytochrome c-type subunit